LDSKPQNESDSPELTQDDFEWGEDLAPPPSAPAPSTDAAPKTTELDRIEFDDLEEPEVKPEPPTSETEEDSKTSDSVFSRVRNLLFNSKVIMLAGIVVILLTVGISLILFIPSGENEGPAEPAEMVITDLNLPPTYEHTLADFIVPMPDESTSAFVSYKVRLTVKSSLYDYYLAKEQRIRADIYEALKEAAKNNNFQSFPENVRKRTNALLEGVVIESAAVVSGDKL